MQIKEIVSALESFAPLPLQDGYDNAGMQVGLTETEVAGALLCLDVTEAVIDEAIEMGCNLIVSHHPLIFRAPKKIVGDTYVERCIMKAIQNGISVYSAHTNLDNARGGVSFKMAEKLGLRNVEILSPIGTNGAGAGVVGDLPAELSEADALALVKTVFGADCLMHNALRGRSVKRVALCGGAGSFLVDDARTKGADLFVTGEIHYHDFFGRENEILLASIGHYESERYTMEIIDSIINGTCPGVKTFIAKTNTNPIKYL